MSSLPKEQVLQVQFAASVMAAAVVAVGFYGEAIERIGEVASHFGAILSGVLAAYATSWILSRIYKVNPKLPA